MQKIIRDRARPWRTRPRTQAWHAESTEAARRSAAPPATPAAAAEGARFTATMQAFSHPGMRPAPEPPPDPSPAPESVVLSARVVASVEDDALASTRRQELLRRIVVAQGSHAISHAFDVYARGGYTLPDDDQDVLMQLLEHRDEEMVREGLTRLATLLASQPPRRKAVLVQRLRRLEEDADEGSTRSAAGELRRVVG